MTKSPLTHLADNLGADEMDKIIALAQDQSLSTSDPLWAILGEYHERKQEYEGKIAQIDQAQSDFESRILPMVDQMKEASDREIAKLNARIIELQQPVASKEPEQRQKKPVSTPSPHSFTWLALATGVLLGIVGVGIFSYFFLIPSKIAEQRAEDKETLTFLDTKEGKDFKKMLALNKGYFPDKCQDEAKRQGVFLTVNKKKNTQVCVLLIP